MRFLRRRPSPAIVISSVALFMSLGGVGYAATQLPANSVGTSQIRNGAVTYTKIQPGAVGNVRANLKQLQSRIWKVCGTNQVMFGANQNGDPKCTSSVPAEVGTTSNTQTLATNGAATPIASAPLASGNTYLGLANPTITVTPPTGTGATETRTVRVSCTLTVGPNTNVRTVTVTTPGGTTPASAAIPLQLTGTAQIGASVGVSCSTQVGTATPPTTVSVTSAVNAVQVQ